MRNFNNNNKFYVLNKPLNYKFTIVYLYELPLNMPCFHSHHKFFTTDDTFCMENVLLKFGYVSVKFTAVNLLNALFAGNDFVLFEPMLAYMDNAVNEKISKYTFILRSVGIITFKQTSQQ